MDQIAANPDEFLFWLLRNSRTSGKELGLADQVMKERARQMLSRGTDLESARDGTSGSGRLWSKGDVNLIAPARITAVFLLNTWRISAAWQKDQGHLSRVWVSLYSPIRCNFDDCGDIKWP